MCRKQLGARFGLAWFACAVVAASVVGCRTSGGPKTQVLVEIDADDAVRAAAKRLIVEFAGLESSNASGATIIKKAYGADQPEPLEWPSTISLEPRNDDISRRYQITATVYASAPAPIAILRIESGFIAHKTLQVWLRFDDRCLAASLGCRETETCLHGECFPALVDPTTLAPFGESKPDVSFPGSAGSGTKTVSAVAGGAGGMGGSSNAQTGAAGASGSGTPPNAGMPNAGSGPTSTGSGMSSGAPQGTPSSGDPSAPSNCGDGKVSGDEKCDTAIKAGEPGACPTQCGAASACEPTSLDGKGCQAVCKPSRITAIESGDGCCPEGADSNTDNDCVAACGNGQVEAGETCDPPDSCPTGDSCKSADACLRATIVGDKASCNATCAMIPIEECAGGDGCCAGNCNAGNDNDCSPSCGDGQVQPRAGELCEPDSSTMPCPTSCRDDDACTVELLTGSANNCNSVCTHVPILTPIYNDGCCPNSTGSTIANANNDNDCQPACGNGVVERGERCDGRSCPSLADCNDDKACTRDEVTGSGCDRACGHTPIARAANGDGCCPAEANANNDNDCLPVCGNSAKEGAEQCDTGPATATCVSCMIVTPPECGNGIKEGTEECDTRPATPTCVHCKVVEPPAPECGNGIKEGTEECDTRPATPTCVACKIVDPPSEGDGSMDEDTDPENGNDGRRGR